MVSSWYFLVIPVQGFFHAFLKFLIPGPEQTGGIRDKPAPTCPPPARHLPAIATYAGVWAVCCAWRWQAGRERSGEAGGRRVGFMPTAEARRARAGLNKKTE